VNRVLGRLLGRVTVRHSVPGRLRLHAPFLAHVPDDAPIAEYAAVAAAAIRGARSVELSLVTASILIRYDSTMIGEGELLELVRQIADLAAVHADRFVSLSPRRRTQIAERLNEHFKTVQIEPGDKVALPDDLWTTRDQ
jgi:hypothetical protein